MVLVNNGGGGIFRFLPIANSGIAEEDFTHLWETPTTGVDLSALCRAHGIPHQKVALDSSQRHRAAHELLC